MQYNSEKLYLLLLVPSAVKTVLSISHNGMNQITSNKQIDNHLNEDIINASSHEDRKQYLKFIFTFIISTSH
jgi:hypothetical protein